MRVASLPPPGATSHSPLWKGRPERKEGAAPVGEGVCAGGESLVLGRLLCGTRPPFCRVQNPVQWQAQALGGTGLALSFTAKLSQYSQFPLALVPNLHNGKNSTEFESCCKGQINSLCNTVCTASGTF